MTLDGSVDRILTPLRFVFLALLSGIFGFGAVTAYLVSQGLVTPDPSLLLTMGPLVLLLGLAEVAAFMFVRGGVIDALHKAYEAGGTEAVPVARLAASYRVLTIIGAAMAEGASLFGIVVVLVSGNWSAFAIAAIGVLVLGMLFPTRSRLDAFVYRITGAG